MRDKHFDHLIQAYHHSLREHLEQLGSDANQLFPFTALHRQLRQNGKFVLATALMVLSMLCMDTDELPDLDEVAKLIKNGNLHEVEQDLEKVPSKSDSKFIKRMSGVLRDINKKGYL